MKHPGYLITLMIVNSMLALGQAADSVDVTFYYKSSPSATNVYLPGEFSNWGNNVAGVIPAGDPSRMTKDAGTGLWWKTVRLQVGGRSGGGVPGAYQYKINENGNTWLSDPRNPRQNTADNNNSVLYVRNPTIHYLFPNSKSGIINQQYPQISAYVFSSLIATMDSTTMQVTIDSTTYPIPSSSFDKSTKLVSFKSPVLLENGSYKVILSVRNFGGNFVPDSATFTVLGGDIQILNQNGYTTIKDSIVVNGMVEDTAIHGARLACNQNDTLAATFSGGTFAAKVALNEGPNSFRAIAKDSSGSTISSALYSITRVIRHAPQAQIDFTVNGGTITANAAASTDPDSGEGSLLSYLWSADSSNPENVSGIQGSTASSIGIGIPATPGEYYFGLIVSDPENNKDTTRSYFTVNADGSLTTPTLNSNPGWVKSGRIYELFFNSFTPQKTIVAATQKLDYLQKLGVNILWIMPLMKNNDLIDNGPGPGYNIVDFYTVAPQYGTNVDFKNFVQQAHLHGIRVILDITPNHTSYNHPFVINARLYGIGSFYWTFYQHQLYGSNPNYHPDLPEAITNDGFVYFGAFGDQILNYNWADIDARAYMIGMFKWWIKEMGVDGYRFDVYWGPHARTNGGNGGESEMGIPVRTALKHARPDVFLLGEASGTGVGTESYYADKNGGVDAAYDWRLLQNVVSPYNISNLNNYVTNFGGDTMGFTPGPNSRMMRFMENHDEDRIAYVYGSYAKTMPMGTMIFTVPGIPMIYSGQEVGYGLGISNFDQRRRGVIDWNSGGKDLLSPHYQRLAWIRATFPALWTRKFRRIPTGSGTVYAYTRPLAGQNAIVVENFNGYSTSTTITVRGSGASANIELNGGPINGKTYKLNDVLNDTSFDVSFNNDTLNFSPTLPAYGSAVYILADTIIHLAVPSLTSVSDEPLSRLPRTFTLNQNYPNPFNPVTNISYTLPVRSGVKLTVSNLLGQVVAQLVDGIQAAGNHTVVFDASRLASGIYFYRMEAGSFVNVRKLVYLK